MSYARNSLRTCVIVTVVGTASAASARPDPAGPFPDGLWAAPSAARADAQADPQPDAPSDGGAAHDDGDRASFIPTGYPPPFGFSPTAGWLDPWPHSHFSRRGTPFVHLFNLEPAFLDRDLFFDFRAARGDDADELEFETELEYALTRRIGVVIEAPLVQLNPQDGPTQTGLGDLAIAPRVLLADADRFLLSGNLEVSFPTGDEQRGLGAGEVGLAPSLSTWIDLGNWVTAHAQVGAEYGIESGEGELFYNAALTYSFLGPRLFPGNGRADGHAHREFGPAHFPAGLTNLILEYTGRTPLDGAQEGASTGELLFGASYNLDESFEIRGGYQVPLGGPQEIDDGFVFGLIYHF